MRIPIPTNVDDLITLAKAIEAKHTALGTASPLNGIEGIDNLSDQVDAADTNHQQAASFTQQAETAIEARDNALGSDTVTPGSVRYFVTSARDVLAGLNKGAEHKLGDWGFKVVSSAASPKSATQTKSAKA